MYDKQKSFVMGIKTSLFYSEAEHAGDVEYLLIRQGQSWEAFKPLNEHHTSGCVECGV